MKQQSPLYVLTTWWTWPTSGWDRFVGLGHPSKFQWVSHLGFITAYRRSVEVNQTLHDVWPSPGLVRYIHFLEHLPPNGILPVAKIFAIWSAFNRVHHLYLAGRPSHWASAHMLVDLDMYVVNGICVKLYIAVISLLCHILALRLLFLFSWTEIVWTICLSIFQTNYTTWFDVFESFCFFN